jgi:multiple sugar transport system ATP-binding protein
MPNLPTSASVSGGQRQRVAMGRAIVRDPKVFLFDEPLSNLDAKLRVAMRAEIKALHQRLKTTTVYVTHDQIEAMTMADRIVVMHDGIVEQIGTPLELFDRPGNLFVAQFIGSPSMNVIEGTVRRSGGECWVESQGARWPVPVATSAPDGQPVHYGIRPGDMTLGGGSNGVDAKVIVVEPTGAETELLVQVGRSQAGAGGARPRRCAARRDRAAGHRGRERAPVRPADRQAHGPLKRAGHRARRAALVLRLPLAGEGWDGG